MTPASGRTVAVILAAGLGTRMRSRLPKVLHPLCGRPMLAYVIDAAREATGSLPLVVTSPQTHQVREVFDGQASFALQEEPRGTGDALRAALSELPDDAEEIVVLSGDVPLVEPSLLVELVAARRDEAAVMALTVVDALDPHGLGRIVRDDGDRVLRIVEEKDASETERELTEINAGVYAFERRWLSRRIGDLRPSRTTGELYLTELLELARLDRRPVTDLVVEEDGTLAGVNDRADLAAAEHDLRFLVRERHLLAGVTIRESASVAIDATVEIAEDVVLEGPVILRGATRIGRDTAIRAGSQIVDSTIGERCEVWASVLESSIVGSDVRIGPFSHLRPGSEVGDGAEIGNFAEIKQSRLGARSKQHHFSYLGDAQIGAGVNIGAGTITANYDGTRKHRTVIGDGAFIGSDTILRAPVTVGDGSVTGAGSVVTRDVPPGKLAVGVPARIREQRPPRVNEGRPDTPANDAARG